MATALKLRTDIAKLKKGLAVKGLNKSLKDKLEAQLKKAEDELDKVRQSGKPSKKYSGKATQSALTKLQQFIDKPKYSVYKGKGVDLKKDAGEGAFKVGKRTSKGLKANQYGSKADNKGNTYYEYRVNRYDVKQPTKRQTYPKLADGGEMAKGGDVKKIIDSRGNTLYLTYDDPTHFFLSVDADRKGNPYHIGQINNEPYYNEVKEWLNSQKMADGGSIPEGYHQMPDGTIMPDSAHMASGGVVSAFEQKIKDAFKEKNKWQFINDNFDGKNVQLKMFVGAKEVDVQRYMIDGLHASMPKNYVGQRETMKMILDAFNRKEGGGEMAKGGLIQHGLEYGDEIISSSGGNVIEVKSKSGDRFLVNLDKGKRLNKKEYTMDSAKTTYKDFFMADGGMMAEGGNIYGIEKYLSRNLIQHISSLDENSLRKMKKELLYEIDRSEKYEKDFKGSNREFALKKELDLINYRLSGSMADGGEMAKGGKLSLREFEKIYNDNEDKNLHSENVVLLAENFGTESDIRDAKTILAKHNAIGYLPFNLSEERYALSEKLWKKYTDMKLKKMEDGGNMAMGGMYARGGETMYQKSDGVSVSLTDKKSQASQYWLKDAEYQVQNYGKGKAKVVQVDKSLPYGVGKNYIVEVSKYEDGGEMAMGGSLVKSKEHKNSK